MKNAKQLIQMTLATSLALSIFTACAPKAAGPVSANNPTNTTTGSNTSTGSNTTTGTNASTGSSVTTTASSRSTMQADLVALHEEEALYSDASTVAADGGFSVKVLGQDTSRGEISATANLGLGRPANTTVAAQARVRRALTNDKAKEARQRAQTKLKAKKENLLTLRAQFKASGAVTVNEDGSITINPEQFKIQAKAAIAKKKENIEARIAKVKDKLQAGKAVAQEKIQKLRRKNNTVRTSDVDKVTNADGSVTETVKIEFENTRINLKRNTYLMRTTMNGKLVSLDFKLDVTHKDYTRMVHRTVTVNADGSRNVSIESTTTWNDKRKREVNQERVVAADGSVTGTGTITWTGADGKTTTRNLTVGISAAGDVTSSCADPATSTTVTVEEPATTLASTETTETATVTVEVAATATAPAEETAAEVNIEAEAEVQAEATSETAAAPAETAATPAA